MDKKIKKNFVGFIKDMFLKPTSSIEENAATLKDSKSTFIFAGIISLSVMICNLVSTMISTIFSKKYDFWTQKYNWNISFSNLDSLDYTQLVLVDLLQYAIMILGIAGIAGSGQRELLEAIAGLQKVDSGEIFYNNPKTGATDNLRDKTPMQIRELGVRLSFVPEDRLGMGLVGDMDIVDNMMLRSYRKGKSMFLERRAPKDLAMRIIEDLEVVTPNENTPVRRLSGGNVQKVLVGREIAASPTVLMAAYPVRGLDINSSYTIYNLLNEQKKRGVAVIFVGEDLDVLIELCDRIMVIGSGRITGIVDGRTTTKEEIGLLMTKSDGGDIE